LQKSELKLLYHYSKLEGWDSEEIHTVSLLKTQPDDFFIAYKDEQLIGFIVAIKHSNSFGFISTFLVLKEFRGLGYGKIIFQHALQHLDGCQIALESIIDKQFIYEKIGFVSYFYVVTYKFVKGSIIMKESATPIMDLEKKLSLDGQTPYMKDLLLSEGVNYKAIKKEALISSFAYSFKYVDGYKVTIDSDDVNEAVVLFFALVENFENGTNIYLQATKLSPLLLALVEALKMSEYSKLVRMYNKVI